MKIEEMFDSLANGYMLPSEETELRQLITKQIQSDLLKDIMKLESWKKIDVRDIKKLAEEKNLPLIEEVELNGLSKIILSGKLDK